METATRLVVLVSGLTGAAIGYYLAGPWGLAVGSLVAGVSGYAVLSLAESNARKLGDLAGNYGQGPLRDVIDWIAPGTSNQAKDRLYRLGYSIGVALALITAGVAGFFAVQGLGLVLGLRVIV